MPWGRGKAAAASSSSRTRAAAGLQVGDDSGGSWAVGWASAQSALARFFK